MNQQSCTVPVAVVPVNYLSDPETEDLIFGDELVKGMVVLIEDTSFRANPDSHNTASPYEQHRIHKEARWCRVVDIRRGDDIVRFIGEYADGSKMTRMYGNSYAWYVKKASMSGPTNA